jgi:hypothetical protein
MLVNRKRNNAPGMAIGFGKITRTVAKESQSFLKV